MGKFTYPQSNDANNQQNMTRDRYCSNMISSGVCLYEKLLARKLRYFLSTTEWLLQMLFEYNNGCYTDYLDGKINSCFTNSQNLSNWSKLFKIHEKHVFLKK